MSRIRMVLALLLSSQVSCDSQNESMVDPVADLAVVADGLAWAGAAAATAVAVAAAAAMGGGVGGRRAAP